MRPIFVAPPLYANLLISAKLFDYVYFSDKMSMILDTTLSYKLRNTYDTTPTQSSYLSALDFCNSPVWNLQFGELDFYIVYFKLEFYRLQ